MSKVLFVVASWEDRFVAGVRAQLARGKVDQIVCLASRRYQVRTEPNCETVIEIANGAGSRIDIKRVDFQDVVEIHKIIQDSVSKLHLSGVAEVALDISTAPRHVVWGLLSVLSEQLPEVEIQYVRAKEYGDWQTDEDLEPRLVLNCSGVMYPDRPTFLIAMCGPEVSRAEKMFYRFEPRKTLLLRDVDAHKYGKLKEFEYSSRASVSELPFDNKDLSEGNFLRLRQLVEPLVDDFNIVCSSFGPKLGSILLFRLIQRFPEIALSYVPAGIHNPDLSKGVAKIERIDLALR